jgi:hypothetical protein
MQDQQLYSLQCASACCETGKRFAARTACTDTALFKVCHPAFVCIQVRWIGLDSMQALELIIRERRTTGALLVKATRYASMRAVCSLAVGAGMASVSSPLNSSSKKPSSIASPFWPAACTSVLNADKSSRTAFRALLRSSDLQVIADFTLRLLFCLHLGMRKVQATRTPTSAQVSVQACYITNMPSSLTKCKCTLQKKCMLEANLFTRLIALFKSSA